MKEKTNTTKNEVTTETAAETSVVASSMTQDLKNSILIVSVVANLFIFTTWVMLQVTTQYDSQLANFLFNR